VDTFAYKSFFLHAVLSYHQHCPCPGFCTASIALFTELHIVLEMISIGTLLAFYLVDNALIYHWYAKIGTSMPLHVLIFLFLLKLSQSPY
jgi:hypothetical protein